MEILNARALGMGLFLAAGLFFTHLPAAVSPPPAPGASAPATPIASDPFIKKDVPVSVPPAGPAYNVILTVEAYDLSLDDGMKLIHENKSDQGRHDRLLELEKSGKAHLEMIMSGTQSPGEQTTVSQTEEFWYPIAFDFPNEKVQVTDYKQRRLGYRLIFKSTPVFDPKIGQIVLFFESTHLDGFLDQRIRKNEATIIPTPHFANTEVQLKTFLTFGKSQFLGTMNSESKASQAKDPEITLVFGKMDLIPIPPGMPTTSKTVVLEHQLSLYSMDREKAVQVLDQKQEIDSAYQAVQALVKSNDARLEHLAIARTDGAKSEVKESTEYLYPNSQTGDQWVTQDTGYKADITPSFNATTSLVFLDLDTQWLKYLGDLKGTVIVATHASQPIFEMPSATARLNAALGEHELIGTFSPATNTGLGDSASPGRVWLEFIRTTVVNP
jgi:hypothetical protein